MASTGQLQRRVEPEEATKGIRVPIEDQMHVKPSFRKQRSPQGQQANALPPSGTETNPFQLHRR